MYYHAWLLKTIFCLFYVFFKQLFRVHVFLFALSCTNKHRSQSNFNVIFSSFKNVYDFHLYSVPENLNCGSDLFSRGYTLGNSERLLCEQGTCTRALNLCLPLSLAPEGQQCFQTPLGLLPGVPTNASGTFLSV